MAVDRQAKLLGKFAEELRVVAVVPLHKHRKNDQVAAIPATHFGSSSSCAVARRIDSKVAVDSV